MRILNMREGFACNSSSTHSIVWAPEAKLGDSYDSSYFGWDRFVCASREAKLEWLGASVRKCLIELGLAEDAAHALAESYLGCRLDSESTIDHQSELTLPRAWSGIGLDVDYLRELRDWLCTDGMFVLGGNDNGDSPEPPSGAFDFQYRNEHPTEMGRYAFVSRKDLSGYWTLFDRRTGLRMRVVFSHEESGGLAAAAHRAAAPELVDVKITDFCPYNCAFCYQGSTQQGKHASADWLIYHLAPALAGMRVFEVAFGGGEPTLHPDFERIVRRFRDQGIVPNVTTRNPRWFMTMDAKTLDVLGAVAVSCDSEKMVEQVVEAIATQPEPIRARLREMVSIQHVLGLQGESATWWLLKRCQKEGFRCVLLGYKTTGRGSSAPAQVPSKGVSWAKWLVDRMEAFPSECPSLGVDTVIASELAALEDVSPSMRRRLSWRLTTKEGQFSCYIDGVKRTMAPSSFLAPEQEHETKALEASSPKPGETIPARLAREIRTRWQEMTAYTPATAYEYARHRFLVVRGEA